MDMQALKQIGIDHLWQVPLCCPINIEDFTIVTTDFTRAYSESGNKLLIGGKLKSIPEFEWIKGKGVLTIQLIDENNYLLSIKIFGDSRELQQTINQIGMTYHFQGISFASGKYLNLRAAKYIEAEEVGKLSVVYKGKRGVLSSSRLKKIIHNLLPQTLHLAEAELRKSIQGIGNIREVLKAENMTLNESINQLHNPTSINSWKQAKSIIKRIAALHCIREINSVFSKKENILASKLNEFDVERLLVNIPFELTGEQLSVIEQVLYQFHSRKVLNGTLIGDVGTGKTVVYGVCAASVVAGGGRVAIMLPNNSLAMQIHQEILSYWPEMSAHLVTVNTPEVELSGFSFLIGTSALLHRKIGELDFVIIDEQQRFGVGQREQLMGESTHVMEVTATPIPRTQALLTFGDQRQVFRLTQNHCEKVITTKLRLKKESTELMHECLMQIKAGNKVLVVCPAKSNNPKKSVSVEDVYLKWNKFAKGKVRFMHSDCDPKHNEKALQDIKSGRANVLISTTIIEIGITIPKLTKTVIYNAERFGTITCHQIRGRLVRHGGHGQLDLYCPDNISDHSLQRLTLLTKFNDGFELATQDMLLRGFGDVVKGSDLAQSGTTKSILIGEKVDISDVEEILAIKREN
ncbi:helicase-related protein [Pseudoalteromonas sp. MQS005]|uniref:helicase-related protein n=1 Tax=Pseudoalteromonas sp. MQS005 TaxID=1854052 RepID=UPI0007E50511|nr:helicase-related protein [Pseudoalteromonas sp. MQS005]